MRILIANDDGIDASGIALLRRAAARVASDIWVVAPERKWTAASHHLSFDKELTLTRREPQVYALNEFREFLSFYPTHARADYAQYRLAMAYYQQMLSPQRDQTATKEAIREFNAFIERHPGSSLRPDVEAKLREARDRLSRADYEVGLHYFRIKWYPGAIDRFTELLARDPEYTYRDAVYFHLAESLRAAGRTAEALPYYDRLVKEFEASEYLERAQARITELKK